MKVLCGILAGACLGLAGISSCNVMMSRTAGFGQVCLMLWGVICVGAALFFQRSMHRWADIEAKEKAESAAPGE